MYCVCLEVVLTILISYLRNNELEVKVFKISYEILKNTLKEHEQFSICNKFLILSNQILKTIKKFKINIKFFIFMRQNWIGVI